MEGNTRSESCTATNVKDRDDHGQMLVLARELYDSPSESTTTHESSPTAVDKAGSSVDTTELWNTTHWTKEYLSIISKDSGRERDHSLGVAYRNLKVYGLRNGFDYQPDVISVFAHWFHNVRRVLRSRSRITILQDVEGYVRRGEMCVVLGRPGSGVSTFLKTIACQNLGLDIEEHSTLNYQGHSQATVQTKLRGDVVYQSERDIHFPHLTVGQTLSFVSLANTPSSRLPNLSRMQYARHVRDIVMKIFGLSHAEHTKLGNDYIRGVSGGERKRVSIAEVTLRRCALQCWDNSTRGLDSATALHVVKTLRLATSMMGSAAFVSVYQASQDVYDVFDKVLLLYEGRQIFFGSKDSAKTYFTDLGFVCPERQTTGDFLTSLTNPAERLIKPGFESQVPRTAEEFALIWQASEIRQLLMKEIDEFEREFPIDDSQTSNLGLLQNSSSPHAVSTPFQIAICTLRGLQRLRADIVAQIVSLVAAFVRALVIGSVFYNLPVTTGSFYHRNTVLFFTLMFNSLTSSLDVLPLYDQRPVVEKHAAYAMYHPFAEAIATFICDLPNKILCSIAFNIPIYLMSNLRRDAGAIFIFLVIAFACTLAMSMIFRCIGQSTRSLAQGVTPLGLTTIASIVYGGYILPKDMMQGWLRWISYINPLTYAFESAMINEYRDRQYACSEFVPVGPGYESASGETRACQIIGAAVGADFVDGNVYIRDNFGFDSTHMWRNFGILLAFAFIFGFFYLIIAEFVSFRDSGGDMVLFRRRPDRIFRSKLRNDEEHQSDGLEKVRPSPSINSKEPHPQSRIKKQTSVFHWTDVCYDINIKGEQRRILDNVDGWVKPGTLTALMGATGAGKTTLLDVLAARTTVGIVSGDIMVNGHLRPDSFERHTGYIQQADLHLHTSTVREALNFSALLRQPASVSKEEKLAYVEEVIKVLEMEDYADAIIGEPGKGLNIEQRKRLSIGVELAARPELLLFLDEPTSGLDSDSAWSIGSLIRKLADNGQAILCTIHQPSSTLFEIFDRILLLANGGRTVYFGDIGTDAKIMTDYFESYGAPPIRPEQNPAEWVLEVVGAAPGMDVTEDWPEIWSHSSEYAAVKENLQVLRKELSEFHTTDSFEHKVSTQTFATSFQYQLRMCLKRAIVQYWRSPPYIWAKLGLCLATSIFIGVSFFQSPLSIQGLQNQMFSLFMLMIVFAFLMYQSMPKFLMQRDLYEARERPAKMYSWKVFMLTNIIIEVPWNTLAAVVIFFPLYYLIGMDKNATYTDAVAERGAAMFLLLWIFMIYCGTFTLMVTAAVATAGIAAIISLLLFAFSIIFCGVFATPIALPGFWIFTYRLSPLTYLLTALLSTGVANAPVTCSATEIVHLQPPTNLSCGTYLASYVSYAGGYVVNPEALLNCEFCPMSSTNVYLEGVFASYDERWRNFGILWAYVGFNIVVALLLYWLFRVPKGRGFWKKLWSRK